MAIYNIQSNGTLQFISNNSALSNSSFTTDSIVTITYPNPTSDYVMLSITDSALTDLSYSLFDISGKALANGKITAADTKIEMGNLPLATYILKVNQNNKELKTFKIIKK